MAVVTGGPSPGHHDSYTTSRRSTLPDQSGGNFYEVIVVVRNNSDEVALGVTGQLSLKDADGDLLQSINPTSINILGGGSGIIVETADLSNVPAEVAVEAFLTVDSFRDGPSQDESPVTYSNVRLEQDEFSGCEIVGTVSNTFTEAKDNLQLRVAGFVGDEIVTGGFTYVDAVFPGTDATFDVTQVSAALCPEQIERIEVLANLGEDKIFNP